MKKQVQIGVGAGVVLIFLLALVVMRCEHRRAAQLSTATTGPAAPVVAVANNSLEMPDEQWIRTARKTVPEPPEQIVREKLANFGRSRRVLAERLAQKHGLGLTPEVEAFFAAIESGDWEQIEATFKAINGGDSSAGSSHKRSTAVSKMWPAIIDAFGAAEQAHYWPAQSLLDYGDSILQSLRPGMVYVGGTDASRWVPALLNDTEAGDPNIVITQNGLADSAYLEYVGLQFEGRMRTLSQEEFQEVYDAFAADARRRVEHDQQYPGEQKQVRHGEDIKIEEDTVAITGRTAVFDMNERLLNRLLQKNPDLSFALAESIPMKGTYADAVPLGPMMELRASAAENFTPEVAWESRDHWRRTAERVLAHPETSGADSALKSYSHDAVAAGNLLAAHNFYAEAEETYTVARQLWPSNPEVAVNLADLYARTGRTDEQRRLLEQFVRENPHERQTLKAVWNIDLPPAD